MQVVFRVDAGPDIGFGHLNRCLVLANKLRERSFSISFWGTYSLEAKKLLKVQKFSCEENAAPAGKLLFIDHYKLGIEWEKKQRKHFQFIAVIDDNGRNHDCDLLLDQNFVTGRELLYSGKVPTSAILLQGWDYFLLRSDIFNLKKFLTKNRESLLITFGGSDAAGNTGRFAQWAIDSGFKNKIYALRGTAEASVKSLLPFKSVSQIEIIDFGSNYIEALKDTGFAISAAGSSVMEFLYLKIPVAVVSIAENQTFLSKSMAEAGLIEYLGWTDCVSALALKNGLQKIQSAQQMTTEIDGLGVNRVVEVISNLLNC